MHHCTILDLLGMHALWGTTHSGLKHTGTEFVFTLYGMKKAKSMNNTHYRICNANMMLHIMCAHLQIILEGCRSDGAICARQETRLHLCGRLLKEGLSGSGSSKLAWYHHLQLQCVEVLQIKKLFSCCHDASLSCTDYCKCEGSEDLSYSPFTIHGDKEDKGEAEEKEERDDWGYWVCGSKLTSGIKCSCGIKWYCCLCYLVISYYGTLICKCIECCPNFNLQIRPLWSLCFSF